MDGAKDEYLALRAEITARVRLLHLLLAWSAGLIFVSAIFGYQLYLIGADAKQIETFLLFLPIIFSCLTFNYQANQMTLEAVAYYLRDRTPSRDMAADWERHFGELKRSVQLISFLKILPLLLPQLLPIIFLIRNGWPTEFLDSILISLDLALLLLILFNFRYKLRK